MTEDEFNHYALAVMREVGRDFQIDLATDRPEPEKAKIHAVPLAWQPQGGTPYGRAVLAGLVRKVGFMDEGGRNECLNRAAYLAGGYVAGGELDRDTTIRALVDAARACGLSYTEAASTIRSGLSKGMRRPITAPR